MFRHILSAALLLLMLAWSSACTQKVSYQSDIKPILKDHCLECHTMGKKGYIKSGLSMEDYAGLMKGTKLGPVIVPGSSVSSTLMRLVDQKADPSINMPHNQTRMEDSHIELIKLWIDQGALNN